MMKLKLSGYILKDHFKDCFGPNNLMHQEEESQFNEVAPFNDQMVSLFALQVLYACICSKLCKATFVFCNMGDIC